MLLLVYLWICSWTIINKFNIIIISKYALTANILLYLHCNSLIRVRLNWLFMNVFGWGLF